MELLKYKIYGKYKPSGVEWLGDVPEHWETVSLKWVSRRYSGGTPDKSNQDYWTDGTIPWLNSGAVNDGYITEPSEYITEEAFQNSSAKWIPKDALVIALAGQGKTKGMVAQLGFKTTCNQSMAAIIPSHVFEPRFLYWWINRNYDNLRNLAGGDARDGLNLEMIGSIPCPLLPLPEQQAIVAFLDDRTGRIDGLVEKKKRLVELLKEKRMAMISRAVTKGLNPKAKLKSSGVEWLGDVPEQWGVQKLKWIYKNIGSGDSISPDDIEPTGSFPVYGGNGIMGYTENYNTDGDDIIIGRVGAKCGNVYLVAGRKWISDNALRLDTERYNKKYLYFFLTARNLNQLANQNAQPLITGSMVGNQFTPFPPLPEQQAIAEYLDHETGKIDRLIAKVEEAIEKLKEYRTAIISAAVTGKIDVRETVQ